MLQCVFHFHLLQVSSRGVAVRKKNLRWNVSFFLLRQNDFGKQQRLEMTPPPISFAIIPHLPLNLQQNPQNQTFQPCMHTVPCCFWEKNGQSWKEKSNSNNYPGWSEETVLNRHYRKILSNFCWTIKNRYLLPHPLPLITSTVLCIISVAHTCTCLMDNKIFKLPVFAKMYRIKHFRNEQWELLWKRWLDKHIENLKNYLWFLLWPKFVLRTSCSNARTIFIFYMLG